MQPSNFMSFRIRLTDKAPRNPSDQHLTYLYPELQSMKLEIRASGPSCRTKKKNM